MDYRRVSTPDRLAHYAGVCRLSRLAEWSRFLVLYSGPLLLVFLLGFGLGGMNGSQQAMDDADKAIQKAEADLEQRTGVTIESWEKAKSKYDQRRKELQHASP